MLMPAAERRRRAPRAQARTCRWDVARSPGDRAHVENSWQSSRARPALMLLVRSMGCNRAGPEDHGPRLAAPLDASVPVGRARMHASMHVRMSVRACMRMYVGCAAPAGATAQKTIQHRPLEHMRASAPARGANADPLTTRPCWSLPAVRRRATGETRSVSRIPGRPPSVPRAPRGERVHAHPAPAPLCNVRGSDRKLCCDVTTGQQRNPARGLRRFSTGRVLNIGATTLYSK